MLLRAHAPRDLVAFGGTGERTAADLLRDVARVAAELPEPTPGGQVLLVFRGDRYGFAVSLLAAWQRGHTVALPPNTQREAVLELVEHVDTCAILHDTLSGARLRVDAFLAKPAAGDVAPAPVPRIPGDRPAAFVFTSGSSGRVQRLAKTGEQLLGEASTLAGAFDLTAGQRVVATVAPGHLYGLLFSVLMPLVSGGSFLRDTPLHAEAIAERLAQHGATVLATVPVHLRGLRTVDPGAFTKVTRIFSSTAPLREETARAFHDAHGKAVTEVFGSSETGGIATRQRTEGAAFTPLPGVHVQVDADGHLCVDSPFLGPDDERPFRTADLAEAHADGTFTHRGRADGVVKVGGHRVALAEMEEHLLREAGIRDAAVVAVDNGPAHRTQLLAALVAEGWDEARVRASLVGRFEGAAVPRRMLFVDSLPREDNGKLQRSRVLRLFGLRADGRPVNFDLDWRDDRRSEAEGVARHAFSVHVPADYAYFDGHFPTYPILPGAAQLSELVMPCVRRARPELGNLKGMTRLKFLGRIQPDETVDVILEWPVHAEHLDFALRREDTTCAAGRLTFAKAAP